MSPVADATLRKGKRKRKSRRERRRGNGRASGRAEGEEEEEAEADVMERMRWGVGRGRKGGKKIVGVWRCKKDWNGEKVVVFNGRQIDD